MNPAMNTSKQFETLVQAFSAELFRYAFWLCGDRAQAEDLVQETFARAWRGIATLRDEHAARAWLYTILRHEHARLYERLQPDIKDLDETQLPGPIAYDTSTEAFALRRALKQLSNDYREPLVLQVLGGFSCDEIAKIMRISANTVMTRVFRARKKLREVLTRETSPVARGARR